MPQTRSKEKPLPSQKKRGSRLVDLRKLFFMSQEQFALWIFEDEPTPPGQPQQLCSQWENERRPMPFERIANRCGVSIDWLMGLSTQMWGEPILQLRMALRTHLALLPLDERARLRSAVTEPADRVRLVVTIIRTLAPGLITERYLAWLLTAGDLCGLNEILDGTTYADKSVYDRLSRFVDLPTAFFEFGETGFLAQEARTPYNAVVDLCIAKGISAERLAQIIEVLA